MRVWIDLTNSPHVLVMRPLIALLEGEGHEVAVTARRHAQTLELLERLQIPYEAIGRHGGATAAGRARAYLGRVAGLLAFARRRGPFAIALGHGSTELSTAARALRIPATTAFDYE